MGYEIGQPVVWPFVPDWSTPVNETLAWLSDVMQASATGAQQVRGLRGTPRRTFAFNGIADRDARRIVDGFLFDIGTRQIMLPIHPDVQWLAAPVAAGATVIPCRTTGFDFVAGGTALLWHDVGTWELVGVDVISSDQITLSAATVNAYGIGDRLYPVRKARLNDVPKASHQNDETQAVQAQLLIDEPCDWPAAWPSAATYRGMAVLEWRGEESEGPADQYDRFGGTVDADTGPIFYYDLPGRPFRAQSQRFALADRADHATFRSLLYQLNGRTGECWVPSWQNELAPSQPIGSADVQITMPWMGYTQFGYQQANRRDLRFELFDGTVLYRRITGSADAGDHEVLQLDSALGQDIDPSAFRQINWLTASALAADSVTIQHENDADGPAVATLHWQAVKDDV